MPFPVSKLAALSVELKCQIGRYTGERSIKGGLGYTDEKLRTIFKDFEVVEIRKMKEETEDSTLFGVNGLLTSLFQKNK